ncbi:MAG: hypothetical protein GWM98_08980 [Nitrospinaceae bacterium]|nr:hypothetical protein [Nitrospinaceae bacterium]NIR54596.1 hypothetical protein [Nitrospinaceae bacterium]NIS85018.1 hypothetical protein [Nitrospinaceae bacterium]NIT81829.1 hypothetical protein [Nitrospinaceae bacterium]NIU44092.1 hypothetical protein [Nitrospinaceae bacterium]
MDLEVGLRNQLDPRGIQVLKKRLAAGEITPQVFKDILKRQMVKQFFQSYRNPIMEFIHGHRPWKKVNPDKTDKSPKIAWDPSRVDADSLFEMSGHKRF